MLVVLALPSAGCRLATFARMAGGGQGGAVPGAIVLAGVAGGVRAVGAVATAEQFPGEGRLTGLALGATAATAVFGGFTPWLAEWLIEATGAAWAPGAMIAVVALAVLPVFLQAPETAPTKLSARR